MQEQYRYLASQKNQTFCFTIKGLVMYRSLFLKNQTPCTCSCTSIPLMTSIHTVTCNYTVVVLSSGNRSWWKDQGHAEPWDITWATSGSFWPPLFKDIVHVFSLARTIVPSLLFVKTTKKLKLYPSPLSIIYLWFLLSMHKCTVWILSNPKFYQSKIRQTHG